MLLVGMILQTRTTCHYFNQFAFLVCALVVFRLLLCGCWYVVCVFETAQQHVTGSRISQFSVCVLFVVFELFVLMRGAC